MVDEELLREKVAACSTGTGTAVADELVRAGLPAILVRDQLVGEEGLQLLGDELF